MAPLALLRDRSVTGQEAAGDDGQGRSQKCPEAPGRPLGLCCGSCRPGKMLDCSNKLQQFSFVVKRKFQNPSGCFGVD